MKSGIGPCGDHPRVCGEHDVLVDYDICHTGSSPRMRGTQTGELEVDKTTGIIPAYAGNTCDIHISCELDGDHPRVCGEHFTPIALSSRIMGSSPRMRGTLSEFEEASHAPGIIPAYAGNTNCSSGTTLPSPDHPRVCGEHSSHVHVGGAFTGSSPRMRGTPCENSAQTIMPADHPRVCGEHPRRVRQRRAG